MERPPVLLYDADCGFCFAMLALVLGWDRGGTLRTAPLQGAWADAALGDMDAERRMRSWHLVGPEGDVHSAGAAVAPLARLLPGGAPLAAVAERMPVLTERVYRLGAGNRAVLGRFVPASVRRRARARVRARAY